jgi:hypothetical protein
MPSNSSFRRNPPYWNWSAWPPYFPATVNDFEPILTNGAKLELRCDCKRNNAQAASKIEVLPSPLAPRKKLNPGFSRRVSDSKHRKFFSCRSVSIRRQNKGEADNDNDRFGLASAWELRKWHPGMAIEVNSLVSKAWRGVEAKSNQKGHIMECTSGSVIAATNRRMVLVQVAAVHRTTTKRCERSVPTWQRFDG